MKCHVLFWLLITGYLSSTQLKGGGNVKRDGTLDYHIDISSLRLGSNWNWSIGLWHDVVRDGQDQNVSLWRMRGVETFVDVAGSSIYWFSPQGRIVIPGRAAVPAGSDEWYISQDGQELTILSDGLGHSLTYRGGNLAEARTEGVVVAQFKSLKGRINSITTNEGDLLAVKYILGRVFQISHGEEELTLYWEDDRLNVITNNGAVVFNAKYTRRLLQEVEDVQGVKFRLSWVNNSGYDPRFSRWMPSAFLVGDGSFRYSYAVGDFGLRIETIDSNGVTLVTSYNPAKTGQILR